MKYLVIDIKGIQKYLNQYSVLDVLSYYSTDYIKNRSEDLCDKDCIFGLCKFIRNKRKFILKCEDVIIYNCDVNNSEITIKRVKNFNKVIFWMTNRKYEDEIKNTEFEKICNLIERDYVQETTKEGYEQCLGPEIGEEVSKLINRV